MSRTFRKNNDRAIARLKSRGGEHLPETVKDGKVAYGCRCEWCMANPRNIRNEVKSKEEMKNLES